MLVVLFCLDIHIYKDLQHLHMKRHPPLSLSIVLIHLSLVGVCTILAM